MLTDYLKSETASYHNDIENRLESRKIFNGTFSIENYNRMIQVNHSFLNFYENDIKKYLKDKDYEVLHQINFDKLDLIEKDLSDLDLKPLDIGKKNQLSNREEAFGALYVIESSMLGGSVIVKTLSKYPSLQDKTFNYFGHYGDKLSKSWKTFQNFINEEFKSEESQNKVLTGARKAYEDLIDLS